jgi:hypothetical protein
LQETLFDLACSLDVLGLDVDIHEGLVAGAPVVPVDPVRPAVGHRDELDTCTLQGLKERERSAWMPPRYEAKPLESGLGGVLKGLMARLVEKSSSAVLTFPKKIRELRVAGVAILHGTCSEVVAWRSGAQPPAQGRQLLSRP